jgi:hypothetical protein
MKGNAMGFVEVVDEKANLSSHHSFEGVALRRYDIDGNSTGAQRCGNFQPDKAGANNYYTFCRCHPRDDCLAISELAEIVNLRVSGALDWQMDWLSTGCEQKSPKFECFAVFKQDLLSPRINRRNPRT